jgi:hypothetical protein
VAAFRSSLVSVRLDLSIAVLAVGLLLAVLAIVVVVARMRAVVLRHQPLCSCTGYFGRVVRLSYRKGGEAMGVVLTMASRYQGSDTSRAYSVPFEGKFDPWPLGLVAMY